MKKITSFTIGLIVAVIAFLGIPVLSHAATYGYVNQSGVVQIVAADNSSTAMTTAPNIYSGSGVILLSNAGDYGIVGIRVFLAL